MALPQAGWMADPSALGMERYWDGSRWTEHVRVAAMSGASAQAGATSPTLLPAYDPRHAHTGAREPEPPANLRRVWAAVVGLVAVCGAVLFYQHLTGTGAGGGAGASEASMEAADLAVEAAVETAALHASTPDYAGEYPLTGSTELARYLEAAMIEHETWIVISSWATGTTDMDDVWDALYEVNAQSPYVFVDSWTVTTIGDQPRTLKPSYTYSAQETQRRQAATLAAAQTVVDELGVSTLEPAAQAATIHDYVAHAATYDDVAAANNDEYPELYAESQEAYGVLVGHSAVCGGYARAFQALAIEAGLDSVVVTGTTSDGATTGLHAWNRVLVDGEWLTVDVTWDDSGDRTPIPGSYLLVAASDGLLDSRAADADWMTDARLGDYGA